MNFKSIFQPNSSDKWEKNGAFSIKAERNRQFVVSNCLRNFQILHRGSMLWIRESFCARESRLIADSLRRAEDLSGRDSQ